MPDPAWERQHIVRVALELGKRPILTRCHELVRDSLVALFVLWEANGLTIDSWGGLLNIRMKRGHEHSLDLANLSTHAFGAAFDINVQWNPLGARPAPKGAKGSVVEHAEIAEAAGWVWGGRFKNPDGMHFELGI